MRAELQIKSTKLFLAARETMPSAITMPTARTDDPANLQALCSICNEGTANLTLDRLSYEKLLIQARRATIGASYSTVKRYQSPIFDPVNGLYNTTYDSKIKPYANEIKSILEKGHTRLMMSVESLWSFPSIRL